MALPINIIGTTALRKKAEEISQNYPNLNSLIDEMFETMVKTDGIGLAAPQINKAIRLFVIDTSPMAESDKELDGFRKVFINPVIEEEYGEEVLMEEGCLSIPDIFENVKRKSKIRIRYYDRDFNEFTEEYDGVKARVIQHEYDHLDGILFTDKISALRKKLLKNKLLGISRGKFEHRYKTRLLKK